MSVLFSPIKLGQKVFSNRIVIAPMAQYSADSGSATPWHAMHLGMLATSGAGLLMIEGTCVEPVGRVTHGCLGLYNDDNEAKLGQVVRSIRSYSDTPLGIQLMHSGRKGSATVDSQGGVPLSPHESPWQTVAPSGLPFRDGWQTPRTAEGADLARIKDAFVDNAIRAVRIGIDVLELHAAHGYLLHQFLSPLSNQRSDHYGGSLANRMRFPLEVFDAVKAACPNTVLGVRLTGSDWMPGGIEIEETVAFTKELEARQCDYIDVTSGGLDPTATIIVKPGYQVEFAEQVRKCTNVPVRAVGMIHSANQAEAIIKEGKADMIAIARAMLANPRWPWLAARQLGVTLDYPAPYQRAAPSKWRGWELSS
ncbi:NADH:flavin oxidoreductase/NADH oxidase [Pollutimonas thiosulfatoxidans]|uniref:Oxidoreductase n=1 Tax=Pollutimonas thiosulfatoxidans TaxID=2028345 RepID=A0A451FSW3_9BURK|nr:NADH:flavin oxidoreductase/NADH oxidase [Pollutimonas thiosulfatoxidans]QAA95631.1 oxidoreductase [Pollutimonas thiosulfatoxidans]